MSEDTRALSLDTRVAENLRRRRARRQPRFGLLVLVLLLVGWSVHAILVVDTDWERMGGIGAVLRAVGRFAGVDWSLLPHLFGPMVETFMMACLGTLLGVVICLPVIWFGAWNVTPSRVLCYPLGRLAMTLSRSIHEIVWGLLFVSAVGLGSLAGILAIAMRSVGFIAKLMAEAVENVDQGPIEAIRAVGGSRFQVLVYGIAPQIMPVFVGTVIFEWDINIRRSAIMGLVGAGGLGLTFHRQMVMFNYTGVTTVILSILLLIVLGEIVSHRVRRALV